ncbi:MAG TPA: hypothetical protein VIJ46_02905, partial [Rhabdochlamydiaceae bacterium]
IFNAIAGLFSSCFGQETPTPVVTITAAPISAPALPSPRPAYNPLQMIAPNHDLEMAAYRAVAENGTRFLVDELRVLKQEDRVYYEMLLTKLETGSDIRYNFARFFVYYFLSLPTFDQPNEEILELRAQFAALSEAERTVAMEGFKNEIYWLQEWTEATREFMNSARDLARSYACMAAFPESADAAHRALIEAGEIIDPDQLFAKGREFLLHELNHTDASKYQRLLGRFDTDASESFYCMIVYHLIFPANVVATSAPARRFLDRLMQTHAAKPLQDKIEGMRATFEAFSAEEQTNALGGWKEGTWPIRSTAAFNSALWELKCDFNNIHILDHCAYKVRDQLRERL